MRAEIVTHPIHGNFGGMLQAYALYTMCRMLGMTPTLIKTEESERECLALRMYRSLRRELERLILCLGSMHALPDVVWNMRLKNATQFQRRYMPSIRARYSGEAQSSYIVGSDQVWRCAYVGDNVVTYFLDFATEDQRRRSIAYAASFGSDEWEGTPEVTLKCAELLKQFKAVSVREHSGIKICRDVFGVEAIQMPDPTLLAVPEDYERVIESDKTRQPKQKFFASYVLDDSPEMVGLLEQVERATALYHQRLMPKSTAKRRCDRFYCTVAQWLRYIRDCEVAITDSFHGCVFSIIYNKPFVCLGNELRGMARFDTLFKTFGLEERLVLSRDPEEVLRVLRMPIDWDRVNAIHESERQRGLDFLRNNLYDGTPSNPHA